MSTVAELPAGSVTFVFTDIEGSTRLLRRWGDGYAEALDKHRAVLRTAWASTGGVEVSTEGDACFVAFGSADAAVVGCASAQQALAGESWPDGGELRVRIGVHTGIAFPREGDYVSLAVHQAARVVQAAHGGQIVASEDVVGALERSTPAAGVELANLGRYRLRDFDGPVGLFQVGGGQQRFPSVRAVPADRHNLSPAPTSFVGRTVDLAEVRQRIGAGRVVSIVGMGGMGKTRLATELGVLVASEWADGVWMVDLSAISDPGLVTPAIADAVGMPPAGADRDATVLSHLGGMQAMIILDNCEQVIDRCAELVRDVLQRCPSIGVLVTSREPLGLAGEVVYRLAPLPVSDDGVELFRARSGFVDGTSIDHQTIVRICERCDGMPLAIELAASRCGVMSVADIAAGLDDRFRLLRSRDRTRPERQRTMTAVLEWSAALLSTEERTALERLSVFAGTFDLLGATAAVAHDGVDAYDVPELVWSLAEKSLLMVEPAANATRYRMLETVRAYAGEHLRVHADHDATTAALAAWYVDQFPLVDRGNRTWLSRLVMESDTMSALITALHADDPSLAALTRLRGELRAVAGESRLGLDEVDEVLGRSPPATPATVRLMFFAASVLGDAGELDEALRRCDEAEALLDHVGEHDRWGSVRLVSPRAMLLLRTGRPDAMARAEALARAHVERSTTDIERADALLGLAMVRCALDWGGETELYDEVIALARRIPDHVLLTLGLNNLAETDLRQGRVARAADHQRQSLTYAAELGMEHVMTFGLITAARIAEMVSSPEIAVRLHAVADARLAKTGMQLFFDDQALSDAMLARAERRLGGSAADEARRSAVELTTEGALREADAVLAAAARGG